jgi:hypothetical protein
MVLQLDPATECEAGRLYGRLEYLSSSRSAWFGRLEELLAALRDRRAHAVGTARGPQPRTP